MTLEDFRYHLALRADYDAEWAGEVSTWIWSLLARGEARRAARSLYWCERTNRRALGQELKNAGAALPLRLPNPWLVAPAALAGALAALVPFRVHRSIYTSNAAGRGVARLYRSRARRFAPKADDLYQRLTDRHLEAFSAFGATHL